MSKKKAGRDGIIYSTDPNFGLHSEGEARAQATPAKLQPLRIRLDSRQRAGKSVTLVEGFSGSTEDRETLGKQLKTFCGTGGAVKDGQIIVQGDQRDKVLAWLLKNGYTAAKKI